jgi:hypothetical protein
VPFQNNDDSPDIESPYPSFLAQISNAIALAGQSFGVDTGCANFGGFSARGLLLLSKLNLGRNKIPIALQVQQSKRKQGVRTKTASWLPPKRR